MSDMACNAVTHRRCAVCRDLKYKVQEIEGVPVSEQRLLHNGTQLADDELLVDMGVRSGSFIHLILRLRGGGYAIEGTGDHMPLSKYTGAMIDEIWTIRQPFIVYPFQQ